MLTKDPFYFSSVRNITASFGTLFNNIRIQRIDSNNNVEKLIRVPIAYASGDKTIKMILQQKDIRAEQLSDIKISLPRLSFNLSGISYDNARKTQTLTSTLYNSNEGFRTRQFIPVPYNFEYTVNIFVKYIDDGLQIIEQILPYFRPHYTLTLNDIPQLQIIRDVPIYITSISQEDVFEGQVEEDRIINWTLTFIANGWIYPPISSAAIIKKSYVNLFELDTDEKLYGNLIEVDPENAEVDDDWQIKITET